MRKYWSVTVSAVALTWASAASAADITTAVTTPVTTATAASGNPDNITITAAGSVKPTSGTAVTLNSSHTVTNNGIVQITDSNDAVGILARGGFTGAVTNTGSITIDESFTPTDSDNDGDLDGPLATGSGRHAIRVQGPGVFTGSIANSGAIVVEGNDSTGISIETNLVGSVSTTNSIAISGARAHGLRVGAAVSGDVTARGSISATGEGAQALTIDGPVAGGVRVQGTLLSSGYRFTTSPTDPAVVAKFDADDLRQGGPTISITGNVARGLLLDAPPADKDTANADEDADGLPDATEGTASVTSFGAAPALQVGAAGQTVQLGVVGTGDNAYGVVNLGSVRGLGVYEGVSATGVRLGVAGGQVIIDGGVRNASIITGGAMGADAIGLVVEGGAQTPVIRNTGTIAATTVSEGAHVVTGLAIRAGASVPSVINTGSLSAGVLGEKGDSYALRDQSGTLTDIRNAGAITALVTANDDANDKDDSDNDASNEVVTGKAVAVDVSANTTGVRLVQAKDLTNAPSIAGEIRFGSGSDRLEALAGTIDGDIAFGAGANTLLIDGGAAVTGRITAVGGTLNLSVVDGTLNFRTTDAVAASSLTLGAKSQLTFLADPTTGAATRLDVSGAASIASGAKLGLRLTSLQNGTQTYTVIQAGQLSAGTIDSSLLGSIPYLYNSSLAANTSTGAVQITVARKTATQLQLASSVASAYEPLITAIGRDDALETVLLGVTDRATFVSLYDQMLPNRSGGIFQWASAASDAFSRASMDRSASRGGIFVQETAFGVVRESNGEQAGYKAWGLGLSGGYETPETGLGSFGVTVSGASGELSDNRAIDTEKMILNTVEAGAYWRVQANGFTASAAASGGYLDVDSDRVVGVNFGDDQYIERKASADWKGWTINARAAADYKVTLGEAMFLRPSASVAYHRLREDGYTEQGGGQAIDLIVSDRTTTQLTAYAGLGIGAFFGEDGVGWGPELTVGWRQGLKDSGGSTTARFASGGPAFTLTPEEVGDQGPVARLSIKGDLQSGGFVVQVGADRRKDLTNYDFRLAAHLVF